VTRLDVWTGSARSGTAPASYGSIYATADSTSANSGSIPIAEFRHSNQAQGIAICYDGLYASGYNPSQPIFLRAKSAAEVQVPGTGVGGSGYGNLLVDYPNSTSAGGAITIRNSAGGTGAFSSLLFETDGSTACTTTSGAPISFNQANGMLYCQNVGSAYGGGNAGKMGLQLWSGSVEFESQTWLPNGFVGIGTTSPNQTLEIGCNNATGQNPLRLSNYNTGVNNTKYIGMEFRGTDSVGTLKDCGQIRVNPLNQDWSNGASMSLLVRSGDTVSTERMTILGTGCVGINQTSPTFLLDISGNGITNNHMQLATTNGNLGAFATTLRMAATGTVGIWGSICYYQTIYTANSLFGGNGYGQIQANQYNDTSGGYFNINTNGTGGFALNGYGNGTLSITSGRVYNSSDGRMKSNINYISETSTPKIMGLKPATFSFTTDHNNTLKMGFIAQDLEQYIPIAVDGKKYQYMWKTKMAESGETVPDLDENGNYQYTDEIRPRSVDNMAIIATLVKAFQEQVQVIEDLKQRIQILESTA
jgi:hypothetical protein